MSTSPSLQNITTGFIGLGSQGAPMARRMVQAGFPLVLWARRPEVLAAYADTPARSAATIRELAAQCDHVGICVVNDADVAEVCAELIPSMRSGSRIAIHSTIHPQSCATLERQAAEYGIVLIDAPVSGGALGAATGTMTVMVGGSAVGLEAARPVFNTFASKIVHVGEIGAGQKAKLLNNTLLTANIAVAHHIMTAADALGVDRAALVDLVSTSSGRSFGFDVYARQSPLTNFDHGSRILGKDVRLLGESLAAEAIYAPLRDLSLPVLALMQKA